MRKGVRGHPRFGTRLSVEFAWIKWKKGRENVRMENYSLYTVCVADYIIYRLLYQMKIFSYSFFFFFTKSKKKIRNITVRNCYKQYYSRELINMTECIHENKWKCIERQKNSRLEFSICQGLFEESVMKNVTQPTRPRSFAKVCGQVICGSALKH